MTKNIKKDPRKKVREKQNLSEEEKDKRQKSGPRQISKSSWRTKAETISVYEELLLST